MGAAIWIVMKGGAIPCSHRIILVIILMWPWTMIAERVVSVLRGGIFSSSAVLLLLAGCWSSDGG